MRGIKFVFLIFFFNKEIKSNGQMKNFKIDQIDDLKEIVYNRYMHLYIQNMNLICTLLKD